MGEPTSAPTAPPTLFPLTEEPTGIPAASPFVYTTSVPTMTMKESPVIMQSPTLETYPTGKPIADPSTGSSPTIKPTAISSGTGPTPVLEETKPTSRPTIFDLVPSQHPSASSLRPTPAVPLTTLKPATVLPTATEESPIVNPSISPKLAVAKGLVVAGIVHTAYLLLF